LGIPSLVKFPINASVFLVVFLPLLLFHAALTIDVRELIDDAVPILTLAILAVPRGPQHTRAERP
jgi:CPA1 family monovalent cation:H+ antiporter